MADAPIRVQLSRAAGWRMPPDTVKVDRTTRWGNPFKVHGDGYLMDQRMAVQLFRRLLADDKGFIAKVRGKDVLTTVEDIQRELGGKNLACWCRPGTPCHADVLLELANASRNGAPG